jgi:uncharacterized protein (TIGR03435 family)
MKSWRCFGRYLRPLPIEVPSRNAADDNLLVNCCEERSKTSAYGVRGYIRLGRVLIEGKGVDMRSLANFLGGSLGESVADHTGVIGGFDIRLEWTPTEGELDY